MPSEDVLRGEEGERVVAGKVKASRADAMREARERAGLTLRKLEEMSGVQFGTIARLEQGRNNGNIVTLELLADALGISVDEYVGHEAKGKVRVPEWVSVTEALPPIGEKVLVNICDDSGDSKYDYVDEGWYTGFGFRFVVDDEYNSWVTHWMFFPKPYKVKS